MNYIPVIKLRQEVIQEVPRKEREYTIVLKHGSPVNLTIWCIDDGSHQTMLLPSDY